MAKWHYIVDKEKKGPVATAEIKNLLAGNTLSQNSFVWCTEFGTDWKRISDVDELQRKSTGLRVAAQEPAAPAAASTEQATDAATPFANRPPVLEGDRDMKKTMRARKSGFPFGTIIKLALVAAICAGGYFGWRTYLYKSPALRAYEQYSYALFEERYDDARKFCAPIGSAIGEILYQKQLSSSPMGKLAKQATGIGKKEVEKQSTSVTSQTRSEEGQSVQLVLRQTMRATMDISPFQANFVSDHTASLVKQEDGWHVVKSSVEIVGTYNVMNGEKLW